MTTARGMSGAMTTAIALVVALLCLAEHARGTVSCRTACAQCAARTEHQALLEVYCAMCHECRERRRAWRHFAPRRRKSPNLKPNHRANSADGRISGRVPGRAAGWTARGAAGGAALPRAAALRLGTAGWPPGHAHADDAGTGAARLATPGPVPGARATVRGARALLSSHVSLRAALRATLHRGQLATEDDVTGTDHGRAY
ncbi:PREDICTED: uncharacterized protein LOC106121265 isoform X2 [Papilio xuthus]|uniref:Uncharacterized protein LOC106121265 isoform X2 n=1 Tax=Papilio xuthus TaxID=66420 RepID=A0AAJ6ZGS7_PAPXU|nr:PREDICTED: uncharacterized protein LOC106121265 isoform X2 [Papilio xuthus]